MKYEAFESRDNQYEWRVEAINYDGDGECFVAIFAGPDSADRAKEYATWKNTAQNAPHLEHAQ